jgi:hypothetical protein
MKQTLLGLGMTIVGLLVVVFNEPLARFSDVMGNLTGGLTIPRKWNRAINVAAGLILLIGGLLTIFRLVKANFFIPVTP